MPDKHPTGFRTAGEQPPIPVGTAVNLSGPNGRGLLHAPPPLGEDCARAEGHSITYRAVYSFLRSSCRTTAARRRGWELSVIRVFIPPASPRYQRPQMIDASSSIMPIPITSTASATGS
jgi:hypothetical protein